MGPSFRRTRRRRGDELQACEKKKKGKSKKQNVLTCLVSHFFHLLLGLSLWASASLFFFVSSPPKQVRFFALLCTGSAPLQSRQLAGETNEKARAWERKWWRCSVRPPLKAVTRSQSLFVFSPSLSHTHSLSLSLSHTLSFLSLSLSRPPSSTPTNRNSRKRAP